MAVHTTGHGGVWYSCWFNVYNRVPTLALAHKPVAVVAGGGTLVDMPTVMLPNNVLTHVLQEFKRLKHQNAIVWIAEDFFLVSKLTPSIGSLV